MIDILFLADKRAKHKAPLIGNQVTASGLQSYGIDAVCFTFDTFKVAIDLLCQYQPKVCVLTAPIEIVVLVELTSRFSNCKFIIDNHTAFGMVSADVLLDIGKLLTLSKALHNVYVGFVARSMGEWALHRNNGRKVRWTPYVYVLDKNKVCKQKVLTEHHRFLNIGIFGQSSYRKNQISAAFSALQLGRYCGRRIDLYFNEGRSEDDSALKLKAVMQQAHELVGVEGTITYVPWQEHIDIKPTYARMHLLYNISYSESYLLTAVDAMALGVPSVLSSVVPYAHHSWVATNTDDTTDMAVLGVSLINDSASIDNGIDALHGFNDRAVEAWKALI